MNTDDFVPLPDPRVQILGASWLERTEHGLLPHRLPQWAEEQFPDQNYGLLATQGAGVRLRFATSSPRVVLHVAQSRTAVRTETPETDAAPGDPQVHDLVVDGELVASRSAASAGVVTLDLTDGEVSDEPGAPSSVTFDLPERGSDESEGRRVVEIWLPYNERVRLVAISADDLAAAPEADRLRWVHHGSSISQGAAAVSPARTWVSVTARELDLELSNLSISGGALMDPFVARSMRDMSADVLSIKIGINVLNGDSYGRRMFASLLHGFIDTVREGHPTTPFLVVSPLYCPIGETVPGPTWGDPKYLPALIHVSRGSRDQIAEGKLTLQAMRDIISDVVLARRDAGDLNLHHLDGRVLYGPTDWGEMPMADLLHPDTPAHAAIGSRAAHVLGELLNGSRG